MSAEEAVQLAALQLLALRGCSLLLVYPKTGRSPLQVSVIAKVVKS